MARAHHITEVKTPSDRNDFLKVPATVYSSDPHFVQQPNVLEKDRIGSSNPYFKNAEAAFFVARDDNGTPVGRISAHMKLDITSMGYFGFLEAVDKATLQELIHTAESWLKERGVIELSGPYSFSINEEAGLLVEGFDSPPYVLMNHAPAWYSEAIESLGYDKAKDLLAFRFSIESDLSPMAKKMAQKATAIPNLHERRLDKRRFSSEIKTVANLFNDAWSENWGFVPMSDSETAHMAKSLKPILPPELVSFVEIEESPVGMIVVLPDINEALTGLNGRLLPFNWAKVLWRLKVRKLSRARVILMGISSDWKNDLRSAAIAALLVDRVYSQLQKLGYKELEMSWVLEDNVAMIRLIEMLGGELYKRYRIYQKTLS